MFACTSLGIAAYLASRFLRLDGPLEKAVDHIFGTSAHDALEKVLESIPESFEHGRLPHNHDLQHASIESLRDAGLLLADALLSDLDPEMGAISRKLVRHDLLTVASTQEIAWVQRFITALRDRETLAHFDDNAAQTIDLSLSFLAENSHSQVVAQFHRRFFDWIRKHVGEDGQPSKIGDFLENGWPISDNRLNLYQAYCLFFRERFKQDQKLFNLLAGQAIAAINTTLQSLRPGVLPAEPAFDYGQFSDWLGAQLGELRVWLDNNFERVRKQIDHLGTKLDQLSAGQRRIEVGQEKIGKNIAETLVISGRILTEIRQIKPDSSSVEAGTTRRQVAEARDAMLGPKWTTNDDYLHFWLHFGRSHQCVKPAHWNRKSPFFSEKFGGQSVTNVSWDDAQAYCDWMGCRLVTPRELKNLALADVLSLVGIATWVDGGNSKLKQVNGAEPDPSTKLKPRLFRSPELGFLTNQLNKSVGRGHVWVDGVEDAPHIDLRTIQMLAERNRITRPQVVSISNAGINGAVEGFHIEADCVTNSDYWDFAQTGAVPFPAHWSNEWIPKWGIPFPLRIALHPVTSVSYENARAYARWKQCKLPTLPQRRLAVQSKSGSLYPWGNDYSAHRCNSQETGRGQLADVSAFAEGESPQGIRQLTGNNWEWIMGNNGVPVLAGGSFLVNCEFWGASWAFWDPRAAQLDERSIGFRLLKN